MRALLVYPEYPETFWNFKHALKFIARKATYPPLGLLTIATLLPKAWEQQLIDMNVTPLRDEDLRGADLVLLSAMSIQRPAARAVIDRCKALGVTVVAGGPLFTANPEAFADVDHLVLNEAEVTLPDFLRDFADGRAQRRYTTDQLADLTTSPVPRWELINMRHYVGMNMQLSRGCPFDCEFCDITALFGRTPRLKGAAQVIAELDRLYALGWRGNVFVVDDNFIGNKKTVKREILPAMCDWMARHKRPFNFNAQVSINLADDAELMELMERAGFTVVFVGIESPNEDSLLECNKIPNKQRDLMSGVKEIQRHGLQVQAGFIVGFDHDPVSIFDRLIRFIQESGIVTAMVGLLNAPHGTRLYQRLETEGRLLHDMTGDNTDYSQNFVPTMNPEVLQRGYRSVVESIYAPNFFYQRLKRFLKDFHPARGGTQRVTFRHLIAAVKMTVVLGMLEKERSYYWRLLFWSLFRRPRLLPLAMALSAYGFHFRKCFESHLSAGR